MEDIRILIESYQDNIRLSDKLHKELIELLDYNTKLTATYGHNAGGGKGSFSSKVENHVMRIMEKKEKIFAVERKIATVNVAEKVLTNDEKEIVDLIKNGYGNKLKKIARAIGKDKDYVYTRRNSAIKKMNKYLKGGSYV